MDDETRILAERIDSMLWNKAEAAAADLEREIVLAEGEIKYGSTA